MDQQLQEARSERDELRSRLDIEEQARLTAENASCKADARIVELEKSLVVQDEQMRDGAQRLTLQQQQFAAVLAMVQNSDGLEAASATDVVEEVRRIIQALKDKSAVSIYPLLLALWMIWFAFVLILAFSATLCYSVGLITICEERSFCHSGLKVCIKI